MRPGKQTIRGRKRICEVCGGAFSGREPVLNSRGEVMAKKSESPTGVCGDCGIEQMAAASREVTSER
jgi:hypothetical protein